MIKNTKFKTSKVVLLWTCILVTCMCKLSGDGQLSAQDKTRLGTGTHTEAEMDEIREEHNLYSSRETPYKKWTKYIDRDVCKLGVNTIMELYRLFKDTVRWDEAFISELMDDICNPLTIIGSWITKYDLYVDKDKYLKLKNPFNQYGMCKNECETIALSCINIFEDTDGIAEWMYLNKDIKLTRKKLEKKYCKKYCKNIEKVSNKIKKKAGKQEWEGLDGYFQNRRITLFYRMPKWKRDKLLTIYPKHAINRADDDQEMMMNGDTMEFEMLNQEL